MMATTGGRSAATEKRRLRETPGKDGARMSIPDTGPGLGLDGAADAGISPDAGRRQIDMTEAARQLQQAADDAAVAYDCIGLGELARPQTYAITPRAAVDAAAPFVRAPRGAPARPEEGDLPGGF